MGLPKVFSSGRDVPIEDPAQVREALGALIQEQTEFSIKVEGTSTLPYGCVVKSLDLDKGVFLLRLFRPLPHELLQGAEFRMLFAVADQRLEALIQFQGREEYLHYRFSLPTAFTHADRRREKRFPFRPRESAIVSAQDGGYPGLGVTGPLLNVSMGGLALRLDRILKLEDGMRIPPSTAVLQPGHAFTRIRVMDIPRLPIFEASGVVSHCTDRGGEIVLGFQFVNVPEEAARQLAEALAFREKVQRGASGGSGMEAAARAGASGSGAAREGGRGTEDVDPEMPGEAQASDLEEDPLRVLARRTTNLVLLDPGEPQREQILALLRLHAFFRIEVAPDVQAAAAYWGAGTQAPAALLACLPSGGEPLAGVRDLEQQTAALASVPLGILCQEVDPAALMAARSGTRLLGMAPRTRAEGEALARALDHLVGLED